MELGCDGVLINSAIANAKKPIMMAAILDNYNFRNKGIFSWKNAKLIYGIRLQSPTKGLI